MRELELLAPARNIEIGIAAIDCGADAVYLAGPAFGARQAAGNSVEDIRQLCAHAHRFGARVFVTLNTIIFENELEEALSLAEELQKAGADALIVQDFALPAFELAHPERLDIPLHASTQCSIKTVEEARRLDALGFSRIVLERELPLTTVREICAAVSCEVEAFVHGALCVCYSGQCYLSEMLAGRSANRGECIQACRSRYDLVDSDGKTVVQDRTLLSLRDLNLLKRLPEMAGAGVTSFKIEGRLKSISYVRNIVAAYSRALDRLMADAPEKYRRASFGRVDCGFAPDPAKSFNRGFTELFFDGRRDGGWACLDAGKALGEAVGTVEKVSRTGSGTRLTVRTREQFHNGDGFSFIGRDGRERGFRADVVDNGAILCRNAEGLAPGTLIYRNLDTAFEKELEKGAARRIRVGLSVRLTETAPRRFNVSATAVSEDGRTVSTSMDTDSEPARNRERMLGLISGQLGKSSGIYAFSVTDTEGECLPMLSAAQLNALRREIADALDALPCRARPINRARIRGRLPEGLEFPKHISYRNDVANSLAEGLYRRLGAETVEPAYEITQRAGAELMRSRYCLLHELGLCRKTPAYAAFAKSRNLKDGLFLRNNGRLLKLDFDCRSCEMTVSVL